MGKKIPMWQILIVLAVLVIALAVNVIIYDGTVHISLVIGAIAAAGVAVINGWKWSYLEKGIINNISRSMQAILILMTVGMLVGTWIEGGIVPGMIYYGLMILRPSIFLPATVLICGIVSLATGSSWTTASTVGIALVGVGTGLNMPLPLVAGAILSGAYFGDKMSPLSDTTNLAPAMAGSNLFDHIKHMVYTVTPSLVISLIIFAVMGMGHSGDADMSTVTHLMDVIKENFKISPLVLIPPLCVILMVVLKIPAIPGLIAGVGLGCIYSVYQGSNLGANLFYTAYSGYVSETGDAFIDDLLTRGGMESMYYTVGLIICAMCIGGILDCTDMLKSMCEGLLKFAKGTGSLVTITVFTCIAVNWLACDQYLSLVLPGRMYKTAFEDRKLKAKNLSRCLEDSGTITSCLCPWNTCGSYMSQTLGVATFTYLPYCFLNIINPIISIVYGFTGFSMEKMTDEEYQAVLTQRELDAELAAKAMA